MIPAIRIKMGLAAALLVLLGLGIILGSEVRLRSAAMAIIYGLSFVAVLGLGYYGASLVYGRGALVAQSSSIGVAAAPSAIEAKKGEPGGKALFEANCQACHAGGGNSIVASLPIKGSKRLAGLEAFERFLRAPAMPDGKPGDMPPFDEDTLADGQAKELYGFLKAEFK
jgi:mono/diheme cytochrome c family protein